MTAAVARPSARMIAVLYLAYFVIAGIGQVLALRDRASALAAAVQVGGTMWYGIVALLLCRLFGDPTRGAGALAMVSVVVGCVFQSLYYALGLGSGAEVVALAFFGLFLVFLGYLVVRSALIPRAIGVALIVGRRGVVPFVAAIRARCSRARVPARRRRGARAAAAVAPDRRGPALAPPATALSKTGARTTDR